MTHLIGDIGNTKTKLCILDKKSKIILLQIYIEKQKKSLNW